MTKEEATAAVRAALDAGEYPIAQDIAARYQLKDCAVCGGPRSSPMGLLCGAYECYVEIGWLEKTTTPVVA